MASIHKVIQVDVPAEFAWQAIVDVGALHTRLVRGFVTDTRLDGDMRTVTFANGMSVNEQIVAVDHDIRRLAYRSVGGRAAHHNAYVQVAEQSPASCRITWVTDLLPHELAAPIGQMVEAGAAAMKRALESAYNGSARAG